MDWLSLYNNVHYTALYTVVTNEATEKIKVTQTNNSQT